MKPPDAKRNSSVLFERILDPEKVKISASAYRLAMEDAIALLQRVEEINEMMNESPKTAKDSFYGVENRAK